MSSPDRTRFERHILRASRLTVVHAAVPSILALCFLIVPPGPAATSGDRTGSAATKPAITKPAITKPPITKAARAKPAPRITRLTKPVALKLESLAGVVQPPDQSEFDPEPLTAEQLAVDTITLDGAQLGTPQIGMNLSGGIARGWPTPGFRGLILKTTSVLEVFVQLPWVGTHLLQVDCKGVNIEAMNVRYGRWSTGGFAAEGIGSMIIDQAGDDSLSFSIAGENHAPAEYLAIAISDADGKTVFGTIFKQCTFKRL